MRRTALILFFITVLPLYAVVYTSVGAGGRGNASGFPDNWRRELGLQQLWQEEFFCNSAAYMLTGGISGTEIESFIDRFSLWSPPPAITLAGDGVLFKWKELNGIEHRLWWQTPVGNFPGIWFHIQFPGIGTEHIIWPEGLSRPGGIEADRVFSFPERNAFWVEFSSPAAPPQQIFRRFSAGLYADGWESLSMEGNLPGAVGEMLIHPQRKLIALISVGEDGRGGIYFRPY